MEPLTRRAVLVACLAVVPGCFGPPTLNYEMLPVEGRLTMDGQPLVNAEVILEAENAPRGFGTTDENGNFSVVTRQFGAGLPAGTYRASIRGSDKTRLGGAGGPVEVATRYRERGVGKVTIGPGSGPLNFDVQRNPDSIRVEAGADDSSQR
jgi:hypothetical protein